MLRDHAVSGAGRPVVTPADIDDSVRAVLIRRPETVHDVMMILVAIELALAGSLVAIAASDIWPAAGDVSQARGRINGWPIN